MEDSRLEEEKVGSFRAWAHLVRILGYVRQQRALLLLCVLGSVLATAAQVLEPLVVRYAIDHFMVGSGPLEWRLSGVVHMGLVYAGLLSFNAVLVYITGLGLGEVGQRAVARIRTDLWRHLHRLPISYFDRNPVGRLTTRIANDTNALSEVFTTVVAAAVGDILLFLGTLVALFQLSLPLTVALLVGLGPPLALLAWWFKEQSQVRHRQVRLLLARLNSFLQECVQGLPLIKSFLAQERVLGRFETLNRDCYKAEMSLVYLYAIFRPLVSAAQTVGTIILLWYGGLLVLRGEISLGTVVAVLFYLRMIFWPLEELADKFNILQGAVVASERIFRILDTAPEPSAPARPEGRLRGHIEFRDVHFAYEPDKPVLRGVSFEVKPGEVLALVGPSGSGKTTIGALLLGFYPLQGQGSGQILVDGVPLEEWDRRQLRRNMALVQQDLFLFRGDVGHNLTLFSEVPPAALERALQVSRAAEVVERLPGGLAAPVQERGVTLSQGERQLLSFCRALATDPPVLILDEATASIDSKTEAAIQEALHGMLEGRTALVVAHRLSTIQEADRILVLKKGEIVEEGSHEELLARDGLYAHLYRTQMLAAEGRAAPAQTLPEAS